MDAKTNAVDANTKSETHVPDSAGLAQRRRVNRTLVKYTSALLLIAAATSSAWWYSCGFRGCPSIVELRAWNPTEGGVLLDRNNATIAALSAVKRTNVDITRVPRHVQAAFVAVEDRRFYSHHGIDWHGVARAMVENVKAIGVREGASTITMQLARNVFLSHRANERSVSRKILEWRYAGLIERALDKPAILERYLNAIYLGNGVYGVEGASQDLFGKSVRDVTLAEAAILAGLPKAPSTYSPRRSTDKAKWRRDIVLTVLERERVATPAAIASARATRVSAMPREWESNRRSDSWAVETVRIVLDSLRGIGAIPAGLNDGQLRVRSSIDKRAQVAAERALATGAAQIDAERGPWRNRVTGASSRTQGALVALDPQTGAMRAIVGGRRMERKGFNRAVKARRQAGSTFKPFVYAVALQNGYTAATMVDDEPITVGRGRDVWTPANYGDEYSGAITVRDALTRSANAATVNISQRVGIPRIAAQAHAQGIGSALPDVPSLALGAGSVTPLELTAAYAPFGNGGVRVQPYIVEEVQDIFGRVLWTRPPQTTRQVLDAGDAFIMTALLRGVVDEGTGTAVRSAGIRGPVAGKTGTTNDGADVWFVGYTPSLVATVWFGADNPTPLGWNATGGRLAAPVWARFVRDGWHNPEQDTAWRVPAGVVATTIDRGTGKLANDWCGPSRREWFRSGTAPTGSCIDDARLAMLDDPWNRDDAGFDDRELSRSGMDRDAMDRVIRNRDARIRNRNARDRIANGQIQIDDLNSAMDAAIAAISDRRGREAARRVLDEIRRAAEQERRRRNN